MQADSLIDRILTAEIIPAADGWAILVARPGHRDFCALMAQKSEVRHGTIWPTSELLTDADTQVVMDSWTRGGAKGWTSFSLRQADPADSVRGHIGHSAVCHSIKHAGGKVLTPAAREAIEALRAQPDRAREILSRDHERYLQYSSVAEALVDGDARTLSTVTVDVLDVDWHDSDAGQGSTRARCVERRVPGARASTVVTLALAV